MSVSSADLNAPSFVQKVQDDINKYISTRENYEFHGGQEFEEKRNEICALYCKAAINPENIKKWIAGISDSMEREYFSRKIDEWDQKIECQLLKKETSVNQEIFISKIDEFKNQYSFVIKSDFYRIYYVAHTILKNDFFYICNQNSLDKDVNDLAKEFIDQYSIKNEELKNRIQTNWVSKVIYHLT